MSGRYVDEDVAGSVLDPAYDEGAELRFVGSWPVVVPVDLLTDSSLSTGARVLGALIISYGREPAGRGQLSADLGCTLGELDEYLAELEASGRLKRTQS